MNSKLKLSRIYYYFIKNNIYYLLIGFIDSKMQTETDIVKFV